MRSSRLGQWKSLTYFFVQICCCTVCLSFQSKLNTLFRCLTKFFFCSDGNTQKGTLIFWHFLTPLYKTMVVLSMHKAWSSVFLHPTPAEGKIVLILYVNHRVVRNFQSRSGSEKSRGAQAAVCRAEQTCAMKCREVDILGYTLSQGGLGVPPLQENLLKYVFFPWSFNKPPQLKIPF